jgi:pimeloyl-ACP methyl ester carboxylesterase
MRLRTEGEGPLVVQLPGLVGGVDLFAEVRARVVAAGFRVAALDNTGDRADDPAPWRLDWDRLAGEVVAALDRLGERDAVLWGTSFGCHVALAAAARHPERVRALLLCFPPPLGWRPSLYCALHEWVERRRQPARAARTAFQAGFYLLNAWEFVIPAAASRLPALARASREAATPDDTVLDKIRLLFGSHPGLPEAERGVPTSIVAGGFDLVVTPAAPRRIARELPRARVRVLRFAGHGGAYSRPRAYARILTEELARLTRPVHDRP